MGFDRLPVGRTGTRSIQGKKKFSFLKASINLSALKKSNKFMEHDAFTSQHCKSTPPRHLSPCLPDQVAYTMRIMTPWSEVEDDPAVDAAMKISHRIHCICPDTHQHIQQGENLERIPFVGEIKTYSLICAPVREKFYKKNSISFSISSLKKNKINYSQNHLTLGNLTNVLLDSIHVYVPL